MQLYSTLHRGVVPLPDGPVGIYVCGPTVYARAHIGNARPFVVFSWLARWLREQGREVTLVHNITDVNDKIYEAAPGASAALAAEATAWYLEDTAGFGLDAVDHFPRVTETIDEIVRFIADLVERGFAYEVEGDVYFRVERLAEYGRLSGQRPDQMEEQEPSALKEDPRDFALWKANKPDEDTAWGSPWGRGRPGWHIECSAMAELLLGPSFAIHGGGLDLVFPHHENELAQSGALGHSYAALWMHNGMLRFVGAKMSKSSGSVVSIREALDTWGRETLLVFFLTAHWRKPIDFSQETLEAAAARTESLREAFRGESVPASDGAWERFAATLEDDFNTPEALAVLHEWRDHELLRRALGIFGLASLGDRAEAPPEVEELARRRDAARDARNYEEADRLRAEIESAGWEVRDETGGHRLVERP